MRHNEASCPNCGVVQRAEQNEDGAPEIELTPCRQTGCKVLLCQFCANACEICGETYCADHLRKVEDGTPDGLQLCAGCTKTIQDVSMEMASGVVEVASAADSVSLSIMAEAGATLEEAKAVFTARKTLHVPAWSTFLEAPAGGVC